MLSVMVFAPDMTPICCLPQSLVEGHSGIINRRDGDLVSLSLRLGHRDPGAWIYALSPARTIHPVTLKWHRMRHANDRPDLPREWWFLTTLDEPHLFDNAPAIMLRGLFPQEQVLGALARREIA